MLKHLAKTRNGCYCKKWKKENSVIVLMTRDQGIMIEVTKDYGVYIQVVAERL